ncbi:hypothetical protein BpHYR1_033540 [Brachionus plicatilis]|uniref:Uncharacterized protein n=1 Tax=Brachionus plicatilis TaxID=10195 RepID=A0A3M7QNM6_BRAPC|nr:hypothetical protein BpHYR1_033540 [Brachionus plicatilis]
MYIVLAAYHSSEKLECYTVSLEKIIIKNINKLFKQHFSLFYYEHQQVVDRTSTIGTLFLKCSHIEFNFNKDN